MQGENFVTYVIRQRGSFQSRDKIAKVLANSGSLDYYQAQGFVRQVESKYVRQIALRQLPMVLFLGVPGILVGLYLTINLILALYFGFFGLGTIYLGVLGLALTVASGWGMLAVVLKIIGG